LIFPWKINPNVVGWLTVCVRCVLPREPTDETENVFRAENALKRNVTTRQPARDAGWFTLDAFVYAFGLSTLLA